MNPWRPHDEPAPRTTPAPDASDAASAAPASSDLRVTFRAPLGQRCFITFKMTIVVLFLLIIIAALYWGALVMSIWPGRGIHPASPPIWIHLVGVALLLPVLPGVLWLTNRSEPTRLDFLHNRLRLGGRWFGRSVLYDDVRLVKLEKPDRTIGSSQQVVIERRERRVGAIWLNKDDARECFTALRTMCEHVPAVGLEEEIYSPLNPEHLQRARWILQREFNRKAWRALLASLGFSAGTIGAVTALILGGTPARTRPRLWIVVGVFPLAAIGAAVAFFQFRAKARHIANADMTLDRPDGDDGPDHGGQDGAGADLEYES